VNYERRRPPRRRDLIWAIMLLLAGTWFLAYLPTTDAGLQWVAAIVAFGTGLVLLVGWWLDWVDDD